MFLAGELGVWTFNIVAREESVFQRNGLHCAAVQREYIPYFIPAAAARTGFDREEMKGWSCLARLDHPSSLSHRIGKRKAAEAIYLLSHRGRGEGGGGGGRGGEEGSGRGGGEKRKKTINIKILSIHSNPHVFSLFHLIISAQNEGFLPSVLSTE